MVIDYNAGESRICTIHGKGRGIDSVQRNGSVNSSKCPLVVHLLGPCPPSLHVAQSGIVPPQQIWLSVDKKQNLFRPGTATQTLPRKPPPWKPSLSPISYMAKPLFHSLLTDSLTKKPVAPFCSSQGTGEDGLDFNVALFYFHKNFVLRPKERQSYTENNHIAPNLGGRSIEIILQIPFPSFDSTWGSAWCMNFLDIILA